LHCFRNPPGPASVSILDQPSFFAAFHFAGDQSEAQSWFKGRMFVADRLMDDEMIDDPDDVVDLPDAQS
jgi:hypothetical protein